MVRAAEINGHDGDEEWRCGPDLVSMNNALIRLGASITTPVTSAWKLIRCAFVGGGVVGLRECLASHQMR